MLALHRFRQSQHTLQRNIHLRPCQERHRNSYNRNSFNLCKRFVWPPSRQSAGTTGLNDELDSKSVLAFPRSQRERERARQTGRERASRHPFSPPLTSRTSSSDDIFKRIRDLEDSDEDTLWTNFICSAGGTRRWTNVYEFTGTEQDRIIDRRKQTKRRKRKEKDRDTDVIYRDRYSNREL